MSIYYPGDADVYLRAAIMPDGSLFTAIFDLSFDSLETLELVVEKKINEVQILLPDGTYKQCDFVQENDSLTLDIEVQALLPVVLIIK